MRRGAGGLLAILFLGACLGGCGRGAAAPTAVAPTPPHRLPETMAAAPSSCPGPLPTTAVPGLGRLVGDGPVFLRATPTDGQLIFLMSGVPEVDGVYPLKVDWILAPGFKGEMVVSGRALSGQAPVLFAFNGGGSSRAALSVSSPSPHYVPYAGLIELPHAGCYQVTVGFPGGSWSATFGAGS